MNDPQVILFPHSYLSEPNIETILALFGPLTIFQPFFMEQPTFIKSKENLEYVKIMTPPTHLNPGENFKTLLSEYYIWMEQNQDKGFTAFLKTYQEMGLTENNTWEIREMIRRMEQYTSIPEKAHTFRWHIILHLARKVEEQHREADGILKALKQKDSLLKGAIEDADHLKNILEDLPQFESQPLLDGHILKQVLVAWFALFGGYLQEHELLITFNQDVMNYCSQSMKDSKMEDGNAPNADITFRFPDLLHQTLENQTTVESRDFDESKVKQFKDLIREYRKNPEGNLSTLNELSKEVETLFKWDMFDRIFNVKMRYMPLPIDNKYLESDGLVNHLYSKTIILMEETHHNE